MSEAADDPADDGLEPDPARLDLRSADTVSPRVDALRSLFPEAVRDGKIDVEALTQALGDVADDGPERFGLSWPGKADAIRVAQRPSTGTLVPMPEESVAWEQTRNAIIEGENLEVLKLLQRSYHGRVKVIYIDPPYNTGKDFVYPDNFTDPVGDYLRASGQAGEEGNKLRANAETSGRYHSSWLSMMWPRLHLARSLLADDGVLAVSIDDVEIARLRMTLDEVFGEENFIATVIWHKMDSPKNSARHLSEDHEYLVLYARDAETWRPSLLPRSDEMIARYKNPDDDPRGPWLLGDLAARNPYSEGRYPIDLPSGKRIDGPPAGSYWRISKRRFDELDADGRIWWGSGDVRPGVKRFLSEVRDGVIPQTYWSWQTVGSTRHSKREISKALDAKSGDLVFDTPKPVQLMRRLLQITTTATEPAIVLDFFAGSGTMGEAVLRQNAEDGGSRRFLLAQMAEPLDDTNYGTIAAVTRARVTAAAVDLKDEAAGFRAYRLDHSALRRVTVEDDGVGTLFAAEEPARPDRTREALLTEVLLARGFDLTTPVDWQEVDGADVAVVAEGALIACFAPKLSAEQFEGIVALDPVQIVLLESCFGGSDEVKVNALQHLRTVNAHRDTSIELLLL